MAKLSFLIRHHNEDLSIIEPLFQSLNIQVGIDWNDIEIVLSDDTGKSYQYDKILDRCPNIKDRIIFVNSILNSTLHNKFQGIYNSSSEYFTCWDCDDRLYGCFTLQRMLKALEENRDKDFILFRRTNVKHNVNTKNIPYFVLTGILCKKEFIIKNNIRPVRLAQGEDVYLDTIIHMIKEKSFIIIPEIIYLYIDREDSVWHDKKNLEKNLYKPSLDMLYYVIQYHNEHLDTTDFPMDRMWECLPYFYWKLQEYANEHVNDFSENVKNVIINAEQEIKNFYLQVVNRTFFQKHWNLQYISLSKTSNKETFHQWLNRVFNLDLGE